LFVVSGTLFKVFLNKFV